MISLGATVRQSPVQVPQCSKDTISDISVCPTADIFAASSWDNTVRVYQVQNQMPEYRASFQQDAPLLCCTWNMDGSKLFAAGAGKSLMVIDAGGGQSENIQAHSMTIKAVCWDRVNSVLITGSWDRTAKMWDLRSQQPAFVINLPERCYTMGMSGNTLIIGTAEKSLSLINVRDPSRIFKTITPVSIKGQIRALVGFEKRNGCVFGSTDGRCSVEWFDDVKAHDKFTFKCHRDGQNVYSVNTISEHSQTGVISTGGSDGLYFFWNVETRQKHKTSTQFKSPVTASAFDKHSDSFIYALGYDWSRGYEKFGPGMENEIYIQKLVKSDCSSERG